VCGVLADSLEKTTMNREHRNLLLDGQLVLISPYDPSAGFNVGNAMQRNKLIYALADASLVVSSDLNKGGTWAGAIEQLDKLKFVPVFVRSTGESSAGLDALRKKGALP
ncbi:DNA-processing protein DprA, partial [Pseudomonas aeruginosa]|nr:DNA-processing protein DprA [Pseudomonas aeruginosa]